MNERLQRVIAPKAPAAAMLIRLMVGGVFFTEGIQKFLHPAALGAGRFAKIGIPAPELMAPFVGGVETICGGLLLLGLFTRLAAIPLVATMLVAIFTTKIPILLGHGYLGFQLRELSRYGFLSMTHEMRTDWAMLLGSIFLIVVGPDRLTLDARLHRRAAP